MNDIEALLLLMMSIGAFIMPFISRKLYLPSSVGEILFGLVMGIFFKEAVLKTPIVKFLGEFGFILLMYLAGLEINFEKIKTTPRRDLALYFGMSLLVVIFSFGTANYLRQPPIYALVYLTTAIGLLFPVLKESGLSHGDTGQSLLIIGSIGEVVSLISLTLFILYFKFGFTFESLFHLGQIIAFIAIAAFLRRLFYLAAWWFPRLSRSFFAKGDDPFEGGMRGTFVNLFIFVALASLMDLEHIVGAFLGGMLFGLIFKRRESIQRKIGSFAYGFLIPIFFIEVGLRFDIKDFIGIEVLILATVITLLVFLIRVFASLTLYFSSLTIFEMALVPLATSFPLTLLVAIATFGLEMKIIDKSSASAILLSAILTALIYPAMFKILVKYQKKSPI